MRTLGLAALAIFAAAPAAAQTGTGYKVPTGPGSLSGVWSPANMDRNVFRDPVRNAIRTVEGDAPPLRPEIVALLKQQEVDARNGKPRAGLQSRCLPSGFPQMMFGSGLPHQTLESPGQVTILVEELAFFRIIRLNAKHADDPDPSYTGDSIGHWEGNTLVVDTIGMNDKTELPGNIPHSEDLHIVERFTRTSKNRVELVMTFDDPKTFTRPWALITHLNFDADRRMEEYYCENNRNVSVNGVTTAVLSDGKPAGGNGQGDEQ